MYDALLTFVHVIVITVKDSAVCTCVRLDSMCSYICMHVDNAHQYGFLVLSAI